MRRPDHRPAAALARSCGSARNGRSYGDKVGLSAARIASATSGVLIRFAATTGIVTEAAWKLPSRPRTRHVARWWRRGDPRLPAGAADDRRHPRPPGRAAPRLALPSSTRSSIESVDDEERRADTTAHGPYDPRPASASWPWRDRPTRRCAGSCASRRNSLVSTPPTPSRRRRSPRHEPAPRTGRSRRCLRHTSSSVSSRGANESAPAAGSDDGVGVERVPAAVKDLCKQIRPPAAWTASLRRPGAGLALGRCRERDTCQGCERPSAFGARPPVIDPRRGGGNRRRGAAAVRRLFRPDASTP